MRELAADAEDQEADRVASGAPRSQLDDRDDDRRGDDERGAAQERDGRAGSASTTADDCSAPHCANDESHSPEPSVRVAPYRAATLMAIAPPTTSASATVSARPVKRRRVEPTAHQPRRRVGCSWTVSAIVSGATAGASTCGQRCTTKLATAASAAPAARVATITIGRESSRSSAVVDAAFPLGDAWVDTVTSDRERKPIPTSVARPRSFPLTSTSVDGASVASRCGHSRPCSGCSIALPLIALGWLITGPLDLTGDRGAANAWFANHRQDWLNDLTVIPTRLASTEGIVIVAGLAAVWFVARRRWPSLVAARRGR